MVSKNMFSIRDFRGLKGLYVKFLPVLVFMLLLMNGCGTAIEGGNKSSTAFIAGSPDTIDINAKTGQEFQINPGGQYFVKSYDINCIVYMKMEIDSGNWVHTFYANDITGSNPDIIQLATPGDIQIEKTYRIFVTSGSTPLPLQIFRVFPNLWNQIPEDNTDILSEIRLLPLEWEPNNYMRCDGDTLTISSNKDLFSLIGNKFGGDGKTDFALPDLSQKFPVEGLNYYICTEGAKPAGQPDPTGGALQYCPVNAYWNQYIGEIVLIRNLNQQEVYGLQPCDGRKLLVQSYQGLFLLIGNKFGGDGKLNFALPDLRSVQSSIYGTQYYIATSGMFPPRR